MTDNVNHPEHYQGKVECIDAIEAATEGLTGIEAVCTGNAIKYLYRWKRKGGVEDLRKAVWYINRMISREKTEMRKQDFSTYIPQDAAISTSGGTAGDSINLKTVLSMAQKEAAKQQGQIRAYLIEMERKKNE